MSSISRGDMSEDKRAMPMNPAELKSAIEAIVYAADEPATAAQMATAIGIEKAELRPALDELVASYAVHQEPAPALAPDAFGP